MHSRRLLLSPTEVAETLGVCRQTFYRYRPTLLALGLRRRRMGKRWKYMAEDLPRVIERMEGG